jgi:high-affinity iron transporter
MFQVAVVVFREFLEIAILISLFSSVAKNIKDFRVLLSAGIMIGAFGASLIAFFTEKISNSLDGMGSELFDAIVILITVVLIISTLVWMKSYSSKLKSTISGISQTFDSSVFSRVIFVMLISSTLFREGTEIVLLLHSISTIQREEAVIYLNGFLIGSILGILVGIGIYVGLFRFATKYIFAVSSIFMTFIAAGLAAEAARILSSIGIINFLTEAAWDTTNYVRDESIIGKILKIMIGYSARPTYIELFFFVVTILSIVVLGQIFSGKKKI